MIAGFPVVIFDKEYHKDLCEHLEMMVHHESISAEDMELLFVTDSVADLVAHINKHAIKKFGLKRNVYKAKWWFGESRK
jgi:predicted Rossmann-fold nucleotide-binding protein